MVSYLRTGQAVQQRLTPSEIRYGIFDIRRQFAHLIPSVPITLEIRINGSDLTRRFRLTSQGSGTPMICGLAELYREQGARPGDLVTVTAYSDGSYGLDFLRR